jgi:hypothetical protein
MNMETEFDEELFLDELAFDAFMERYKESMEREKREGNF